MNFLKKVSRRGWVILGLSLVLLVLGLVSVLNGRFGWAILILSLIMLLLMGLPDLFEVHFFQKYVTPRARQIIYSTLFGLTFLSSFAGSTIAENHAVALHHNDNASVISQIPAALDQTGMIFALFFFFIVIATFLLEDHVIPGLTGYRYKNSQTIDPLTSSVNISLRGVTIVTMLFNLYELDKTGAALQKAAREIGEGFGKALGGDQEGPIQESLLSKWQEVDIRARLFQTFRPQPRPIDGCYDIVVSSTLMKNLCSKIKDSNPAAGCCCCDFFLIPYVEGVIGRKGYSVKVSKPQQCEENCDPVIELSTGAG